MTSSGVHKTRLHRKASVKALSKIKTMQDEHGSLLEESQGNTPLKKKGSSKKSKTVKHSLTLPPRPKAKAPEGEPELKIASRSRRGSRHLKRETFPVKLFHMLEGGKFKDAIDYAPGGESIVVKNIKRLEESLPKAGLNQSKLRSFHRQLSFWGFSRVQGGKATLQGRRSRQWYPEEWAHPDFIQGMPRECLQLVVRVGAPLREKKLQTMKVDQNSTPPSKINEKKDPSSHEPEPTVEGILCRPRAVVTPVPPIKAREINDYELEAIAKILLETDDDEVANIMDVNANDLINWEDDAISLFCERNDADAKEQQVARRISFHPSELAGPREQMDDKSFLDTILAPMCLDRGESAFSFISAISDEGCFQDNDRHDFQLLHPLSDALDGWDDGISLSFDDNGLSRRIRSIGV